MTRRAPSERALLVLLAAVTATGPVSLNIYLPVVPLARDAFGVSVAAANATVSAPLVAFAVGLFAYGPLSDHYGRRPVVLAGLAIFVIGCALCFGLSLDMLPDLYSHLTPWLRPLFESSLTLSTVIAVVLNQLLRVEETLLLRRKPGPTAAT